MDAFYTPNDNITALLKAVLKDYENLPANFYYYKDIKERYGLPLLELEKKNITNKSTIIKQTKNRRLSNRQKQKLF